MIDSWSDRLSAGVRDAAGADRLAAAAHQDVGRDRATDEEDRGRHRGSGSQEGGSSTAFGVVVDLSTRLMLAAQAQSMMRHIA